jgi:hypothetical protein
MLVRTRRLGQAILVSAEDALKGRPIRATLSLSTTLRYSAFSQQWAMYGTPVEACLHTAQCVRIRVRARLGGARRGQGGHGGLAVQLGRQFSTPRRAEAIGVALHCSISRRLRRGNDDHWRPTTL